jgi:hypothetical protein
VCQFLARAPLGGAVAALAAAAVVGVNDQAARAGLAGFPNVLGGESPTTADEVGWMITAGDLTGA